MEPSSIQRNGTDPPVQSSGAEWSPIVPLQTGGSKPPFFLVHGFGGGVAGYGPLAHSLGPDQTVYGFISRGMDTPEEPHTRIEAMASAYIRAMQSVQPEPPYFIGGYSYGGIVAYEMACQLAAAGEQVGLLAILDGYAPIRLEKRSFKDHLGHAIGIAKNLPGWLSENWERGFGRLASEIWRRIINALKAGLQRVGVRVNYNVKDLVDSSAQIDDNLRKIYEAQVIAGKQYKPGKYSGCVTLFRVKNLSLRRSSSPSMGWERLASGGVLVKMVPGYHYNLLEPPYVTALAKALKSSLEESQYQPAQP